LQPTTGIGVTYVSVRHKLMTTVRGSNVTQFTYNENRANDTDDICPYYNCNRQLTDW